jgi:hypothetical protein
MLACVFRSSGESKRLLISAVRTTAGSGILMEYIFSEPVAIFLALAFIFLYCICQRKDDGTFRNKNKFLCFSLLKYLSNF